MTGTSKLFARIIGILVLLIFMNSPALVQAMAIKENATNTETKIFELTQDKKKTEKELKESKSRKSNARSSSVLKTASQYLGVPYRFGGDCPKGFDCSGYVKYVFEKHGKKLPRTADAQFKAGNNVKKSRLKEGDLVFFTTYAKGPSHVGIYYGKNRFIHASASRGVMVSNMNDSYWKGRYVGARRIL